MSGVRVEAADGIVTITLDRPKANAVDAKTSREIGEALVAFRDDPVLRVAILTGAGERFFSAGFDLKSAGEFEGIPDQSPGGPFGPGGFAGITELPRLWKPVIAAVNGAAVGGGCEMALASDIVIAADHATFAVPEAKVGLIADAGGLQRLAGRVPYVIAMEMLLAGRVLTAAEAVHYGLINHAVPKDQLMARAQAAARAIADAGPLAVQAIKQVVSQSEGMKPADIFAAVRAGKYPLYAKAMTSEDAKEGPLAFSEKRKPVFKGR
jgi:crotonobetainyl-CoA hydratase